MPSGRVSLAAGGEAPHVALVSDPHPRAFRFQRKGRALPFVYAHRGARARAPENTLAAFELARVEGADGIELDVRTTRDGVVVVVHDLDLTRVTGGHDSRVVGELTARELRDVVLDVGGREGRVPTLAEVLDWAAPLELRVNVELKHDDPHHLRLVRGVSRLLRGRLRVTERVILSSFHPRLLTLAAAFADRVPRAFIVHAGQRLAWTQAAVFGAKALGVLAYHPERKLCTPSLVAAWKRAGLVVNPWTVNDVREALDLAALGVDGLITDDPAGVLAALRARA